MAEHDQVNTNDIFTDLENGAEAITLNEARKLSIMRRNGQHLDVSVMHRYASHGLRGIKLETFQSGGSRCTTKPAIIRFLKRLSGHPVGPVASPRANEAHCRASKLLAAAGL